MSLRRDIKNTFDSIHAPEDLVEHMKQDLYQKDFHEEEDDEATGVAPAPKRTFRRFFLYAAACTAVCAVGLFSILSLRDHQNNFHPGKPVVVEPDMEETTEPLTEATEYLPQN